MSRTLQGESISPAFDDAIKYFGGVNKLAIALGVTGSQVRRLRVGENKLSLKHAQRIESFTKGEIKASEFFSKIESIK